MDAIEREVAKVVRTGCARLPLSCTRSIEEPISGTGSPPVWSILSVVGETAVDRWYNHRGISPPEYRSIEWHLRFSVPRSCLYSFCFSLQPFHSFHRRNSHDSEFAITSEFLEFIGMLVRVLCVGRHSATACTRRRKEV